MELNKNIYNRVTAYLYFALGVHYGYRLFNDMLDKFLETYDDQVKTDIHNFISTFINRYFIQEIEDNIILATNLLTPAHKDVINEVESILKHELEKLKK